MAEKKLKKEDEMYVEVQNSLHTRVLYTNPVCGLLHRDPTSKITNGMTISWLTATDNHGGLFLSINSQRRTIRAVGQCPPGTGRLVTLSVASEGMIPVLNVLGGSHGHEKMARVDTSELVWTGKRTGREERKGAGGEREEVDAGSSAGIASLPYLTGALAVLVVRIDSMEAVSGHERVFGTILHAMVEASAWIDCGLVGGVAFLGRGNFAVMKRLEAGKREREEAGAGRGQSDPEPDEAGAARKKHGKNEPLDNLLR